MNRSAINEAFGVLVEPATLEMRRLLPGPIERVWAYLVDSDLRRQWLASGAMDLTPGAPFELTWHNDALTDPPGARPDGFDAEHSMDCEIIAADPPRRLAFAWPGVGEVTFELAPQGDDVLLTLVHRRLADRRMTLMVGAGWHMHLAVLVARLWGETPEPFWDGWTRLHAEYDRRVPA